MPSVPSPRNPAPRPPCHRAELLPPGTRLLALDVAGNPGCTPEVERRLGASSLLAEAEFLNGRRLQRG